MPQTSQGSKLCRAMPYEAKVSGLTCGPCPNFSFNVGWDRLDMHGPLERGSGSTTFDKLAADVHVSEYAGWMGRGLVEGAVEQPGSSRGHGAGIARRHGRSCEAHREKYQCILDGCTFSFAAGRSSAPSSLTRRSQTGQTEDPNPDDHPSTAEEYNAILLSNPHMVKSSTYCPSALHQAILSRIKIASGSEPEASPVCMTSRASSRPDYHAPQAEEHICGVSPYFRTTSGAGQTSDRAECVRSICAHAVLSY